MVYNSQVKDLYQIIPRKALFQSPPDIVLWWIELWCHLLGVLQGHTLECGSIKHDNHIVESKEILSIGKEDWLSSSNMVADTDVKINDGWVDSIVFGGENSLEIVRVQL